MSAAAELQAAIVAATSSLPALSGVYDGPPARAEFPYLVVDCSSERDWSASLQHGREIEVKLVLWGHPGPRFLDLEEALQECALPGRTLANWSVSSLALAERKRTRSPEGAWGSHLTLRARLLAIESERS